MKNQPRTPSITDIVAYIIFLSVLTASITNRSHADGGSGVRAAERVEISGKKYLRDLHDRTNCEWITGADYLKNLDHKSSGRVSRLLEKIETLNWYFALDLRRTTEGLDICKTKDIPAIQEDDYEEIRQYITEFNSPRNGKIQKIALRYNNEVRLNVNEANQLPEIEQIMLPLHEGAHSYLRYETPLRDSKLRSMINYISQIEGGKKVTAAEFNYQLRKNMFVFEPSLGALRRIRKKISIVLGSYENRKKALMGERSPLALLSQPCTTTERKALLPDHVDLVCDTKIAIETIVEEAALQNDIPFLNHILSGRSDESLDLFGRVLSLSDEMALSEVKGLLQNLAGSFIENDAFHSLHVKRVFVEDHLVQVSSNVTSLAAQSTVPVRIGENSIFRPRALKSGDYSLLTNPAAGYLARISASVEKSGIEPLLRFIRSERFVDAFGIVPLLSDLEKMRGSPGTIDDDLDGAYQKLPEIFAGFWQVALDEIERVSDQENRNRVRQAINLRSGEIGFSIK